MFSLILRGLLVPAVLLGLAACSTNPDGSINATQSGAAALNAVQSIPGAAQFAAPFVGAVQLPVSAVINDRQREERAAIAAGESDGTVSQDPAADGAVGLWGSFTDALSSARREASSLFQ